jgi:hypothetical protein
MKRDYKLALSMIRTGALMCQEIDNERNLEEFKLSQQRIKARHSEAQNTDDMFAPITSQNSNKEANHV